MPFSDGNPGGDAQAHADDRMKPIFRAVIFFSVPSSDPPKHSAGRDAPPQAEF
jgi:hypothetical protein